jgi:hypothetical protein
MDRVVLMNAPLLSSLSTRLKPHFRQEAQKAVRFSSLSTERNANAITTFYFSTGLGYRTTVYNLYVQTAAISYLRKNLKNQ